MICDIRCNYIMSVNKKCEFCNCTPIMKLHERLDFIKYQQFVHITLKLPFSIQMRIDVVQWNW